MTNKASTSIYRNTRNVRVQFLYCTRILLSSAEYASKANNTIAAAAFIRGSER